LGPDSKDALPWLQLKLAAPKSMSPLKLMKGKFGSRVQE